MPRTQHLEEVIAGLQAQGIENVSGIDAVDGVIIIAPAGSEEAIMKEVEKKMIDEGATDVNP